MNNTMNEYPKLDIPLKPSIGVGNIYRMNDYIEYYPFKNNIPKGFRNREFYGLSYRECHYPISNHNDNNLKGSDNYHYPCGIMLSINYIDFLNFLKQTGIILKTYKDEIDSPNVRYQFLSYLNSMASEMDEYILNNLYSMEGKIEGVGKLIKNGNEYHIGNNIVQEYDSYLNMNNNKKVNYARMIMNDGVYHWIKIEPLTWRVDKKNNQLISNIVIPFDTPFDMNSNCEDCVKYINDVLYKEMNYHPEQYMSNNIRDIVKDGLYIKRELCRYKDYLINNNEQHNNSKTKVQGTKKRL